MTKALRAPAIKKLASDGVLQLSLFDQTDLAEITHQAFPGERLIACRNPLLAAERSRKRGELLTATEKELEKAKTATQRNNRRLRGKERIAVAVGKALGHYKMAKHFHYRMPTVFVSIAKRIFALAPDHLLTAAGSILYRHIA